MLYKWKVTSCKKQAIFYRLLFIAISNLIVVIIRGHNITFLRKQQLTVTLDSGAFEAEPNGIFMPPSALIECNSFSIQSLVGAGDKQLLPRSGELINHFRLHVVPVRLSCGITWRNRWFREGQKEPFLLPQDCWRPAGKRPRILHSVTSFLGKSPSFLQT